MFADLRHVEILNLAENQIREVQKEGFQVRSNCLPGFAFSFNGQFNFLSELVPCEGQSQSQLFNRVEEWGFR
jgi:hypothetical protein